MAFLAGGHFFFRLDVTLMAILVLYDEKNTSDNLLNKF